MITKWEHPRYIQEEDLLLMLDVRKKMSYREMAKSQNKSLRLIQMRMAWLKENGYIAIPEQRGWRNHKLTIKGEEEMKKHGLERKDS